MKIQFFLSADNIAHARGILTNGFKGSNVPSEFCWGSLMILEGDCYGKCLFLEHIALADFFCDFKRFLVAHKNEVNAIGQIVDMYESYGFYLEKKKNVLIVKTNVSEMEATLEFDYAKALHKVRFASQSLFKELIHRLPELGNTEGLRGMLL